jgi:oxygen-dependent protoporphyrinogen oxidase
MKRVAIVGGGIAGLTAAYEIAQQARAGASIEAVLFESSTRLGGLIETVREGGFTVECGPDGWVSAKPWARELAIELGLADELISSNDASRKTWILLATPENPAGHLVPMPDGFHMMVPGNLAALDHSPLLTDAAIAAYRAEPGRAAELLCAVPAHDESVADFTLRHFGPEVLDRIAAPLLSGVFGGDVRRLSVRSVMPAFVEMERAHGSLISAVQRRTDNGERSTPIFTTLRSGLGTLVDRLTAAIPPHWFRLNTTVTAIQSSRPKAQSSQLGSQTIGDLPPWTVLTKTGRHHGSETFDAVFLATPLSTARQLIAPLDDTAADLFPTESSSAVLVAFCYADAGRVPLSLTRSVHSILPPAFFSPAPSPIRSFPTGSRPTAVSSEPSSEAPSPTASPAATTTKSPPSPASNSPAPSTIPRRFQRQRPSRFLRRSSPSSAAGPPAYPSTKSATSIESPKSRPACEPSPASACSEMPSTASGFRTSSAMPAPQHAASQNSPDRSCARVSRDPDHVPADSPQIKIAVLVEVKPQCRKTSSSI